MFLWVFGVQLAYTELIGNQGIAEFIKIIKSSSIVILFISAMILGWTSYNYLCFWVRGERRNSRGRVCYDEDFCALCHLDLPTLQAAKNEPRLKVTLSGNRVEVHPSPPPPGEAPVNVRS